MLFGPAELRGTSGMQLTNPQYEIVDEGEGETIHTGRIVPVYEKAGTVTAKMQRKIVHDALERLPADLRDPLPGSDPESARLAGPLGGAAGRAFSAR